MNGNKTVGRAHGGFLQKANKKMEIKKFIIKDVRCFEDETEFNIRPLTFLIGENSTGKSTVLGSMQALRYGMDHSVFMRNADKDIFDGFNIDPYEMGTFANIAYRGILDINPEEFVLRFGLQEGNLIYTHSLIFGEKNDVVYIVKKELEFSDGKIIMEKSADAEPGSIEVSENRGKNSFAIKANAVTFAFINYKIDWILYELKKKRAPKRSVSQKNLIEYLKGKIKSSGKSAHDNIRPFYSIAPVRSKPKRTYDPITIIETSQGDEVPAFLMRMKRSEKARWNALSKRLEKFGKDSGMFKGIEIKAFSSSPHEPFQLHFKVRKKQVNMADLGYGVSQVLPILVSAFTKDNSTFLMQQPEVHLHPKAQAELLSVLTDDIKTRGNRYVLETHSDYMLDRARIEIMKGKISPEDVSLIYLEPAGNKVVAHNIAFDKQGNFIGMPKGYRSFFDKEVDNLLGF